MKLEHRQQKVVPLTNFFIRMLRFAGFSLGLIVVSLLIGTLGYRHAADLEWVDSFYMSTMILTGMGPVAEMKTDAAKLFSAFYALYGGIAFLSITATFFAPIVHRLLHILQVEPDAEK